MLVRPLIYSQMVLLKMREKIYEEFLSTGQITNLIDSTAADMTTTSTTFSLTHHSAAAAAVGGGGEFSNLQITLFTLGTICILLEMFELYKFQKLKDTELYNKIEKTVEMFFVIFVTILFRDVSSAI